MATPRPDEIAFVSKRERAVVISLKPRHLKLVASAKPVVSTAPVASGTGTVGQTLSCTTGVWTPAGKPFVYAYQWLRAGVAIAGATTSTHLLVAADSAKNLSCAVTATNSEGAATATSNAIAVE